MTLGIPAAGTTYGWKGLDRSPSEGNVRELVINGHRIADDTDAYVIAEIGHNHGGRTRRRRS
jgi:hypothetical protein